MRLAFGNSEAGVLVANDEKNDLAVVRVMAIGEPPTSIAVFREGAPIRAGDSIVALGYPLSGLLSSDVQWFGILRQRGRLVLMTTPEPLEISAARPAATAQMSVTTTTAAVAAVAIPHRFAVRIGGSCCGWPAYSTTSLRQAQSS